MPATFRRIGPTLIINHLVTELPNVMTRQCHHHSHAMDRVWEFLKLLDFSFFSLRLIEGLPGCPLLEDIDIRNNQILGDHFCE